MGFEPCVVYYSVPHARDLPPVIVFQTAELFNVHADAVTASQDLFVGNHRSSRPVPPCTFEIRIRCVKRGLNSKWDQLFHFLTELGG
jgi:hypothetical protein